MKEYLIKKTGKDSNTYSVYRNPDAELKKKIAAFKLKDSKKVTLGWPEETWTIESLEGDEYKCTNGKNVHYFPKKEIEEKLKRNLEEERNRAFPAYKYFKKAFGVLSSFAPDPTYTTLNKIDLQDSIPFFKGVKPRVMKVEHFGNFHEYKLNLYSKKWGNDEMMITVETNRGESMNLYFNEEGDYVNRDYNQNLDFFKNEDISPSILYDKFKENFFKTIEPELERYGEKFFSKKFCYLPFYNNEDGDIETGISFVPVRADGKSYQKESGSPIIKKPAKAIPATNQDLWNEWFSKLENRFFHEMQIKKEEQELKIEV